MRKRKLTGVAAGGMALMALASAVLPFGTPVAQAVPPQDSFAVVAATDAEIVHGVVTMPPTSPPVVVDPETVDPDTSTSETVTDTAVAPDGERALVQTNRNYIAQVTDPGSATPSTSLIDLSTFTGEGGSSFNVFGRGVDLTPDGRAGLATINSQGVVVLRRTGSAYEVDASVQSPGLNEAGNTHDPGFLRGPAGSETTDGVVIGRAPGADGRVLALTRDNDDINVITGLGSAPAFAGAIVDARLSISSQNGNGGMAFSPVRSDVAVVATVNGIAPVFLANPQAPVLGVDTPLEATDDGVSVAISADGDHVIASDGEKLFFLKGLLDAGPTTVLQTYASPINLGTSIRAIEVTTNDTLVVSRFVGGAPLLSFVTDITTPPAFSPGNDVALSSAPATNGLSVHAGAEGYRFVASDGGVFNFGRPGFLGSQGATRLNQPVVGMAETPDRNGYWLVARDGGIFTHGNAGFFGSQGATRLNQPIVGMASTPSGLGYWMVASDGGIFTHGDAGFFGSQGATRLNQPIVGMAPTPTGRGYWLVARDGGIFSHGDAAFFGSTGGIVLNQPVVGMAATPSGRGYWMVASDGGIFAFGDAGFFGSTGAIRLNQPVVGMSPTANGAGYWLVARDGGIFSFGNAAFLGSTGAITLNQPIVGMAA